MGLPGWAYAVTSILATTSIALVLRSRRRADHVRADAREWAEERFRGLVEQLPVTVYIDAVDSLSTALYISPQYEQLTGYPSELRESTPDFWVDQLLHPDDRDQVLEESLRTNATGDPFDVEYRIIRKDGSVRWVHDNAVLVDGPGGEHVWQGVLVDITERKLAEQALHEAEERFRAIVEHMPGAIYLDEADSSMQPVYVSPQIERITGMTSEEWMASTDAWVDLVHPEDRTRVVDGYLAAMATRQPWAAEYRMITRDGRAIWVQDETTFLRDRLGRDLVQGVIFDVTEQKLAEQALQDSERREREAAAGSSTPDSARSRARSVAAGRGRSRGRPGSRCA